MAAVTVFVDDAVLGNLPPICVKDGVWTDDQLTFSQQIGTGAGLGVAWLLVLAGPLGWIGLIAIAASRRGEALRVTLPYCEDAHRRWKTHLRARLQATALMFGAFIAAFVCLLPRATESRLLALCLAVVGCGALVKVIVEWVQVNRATVHLHLDASRRWVTLSGVHPNFQAAVERQGHDSERTSSYR
jgi:hypothetical protein